MRSLFKRSPSSYEQMLSHSIEIPCRNPHNLVMSFMVILGHPLRKPFCVAFNNLDVLGLHND